MREDGARVQAGGDADRCPAARSSEHTARDHGEDPGLTQRGLADPGGPGDDDQRVGVELIDDRAALGIAAEEDAVVRGIERPCSEVGGLHRDRGVARDARERLLALELLELAPDHVDGARAPSGIAREAGVDELHERCREPRGRNGKRGWIVIEHARA